MTEEKKTVTKKAPVKKVAPKKAEPVKETVVEQRKLEKNDDVLVMNNTTGRYGYKSRSGYAIEMNEYGDTEYIPFGELHTMRSSQKRHIEDAFIVILDEVAIKQLGYEKLYENILSDTGVEEILNDHERLGEMLSKMPKIMRETVGAVASRKFKDGELYDTRVKKVIEDNLKIKIDV